MPIILGLQQGIEGFIWLSINSENYSYIHVYTYLYLFFAFYLWPALVPISVYFTESNPLRKKILLGFIIAGQILGVILYMPLLVGVIPFSTTIIKQSIHYATYHSTLLLWIYSIGYIGMISMPLLLASSLTIRIFGLMVLLSSLICYWLYLYVFTSMWCFFAAVLSIYIAHIIIQLPKKQVKLLDIRTIPI